MSLYTSQPSSAQALEHPSKQNSIPTPTQHTANRPSPEMCIITLYSHPSCGHRASGTAEQPYQETYCQTVWDNALGPNWPRPCIGRDLTYNEVNVRRAFCDRCIMTGNKVMMEQGLGDPDVYARSMGVSVDALMRAHPDWRP
jgi:hypothetical protein